MPRGRPKKSTDLTDTETLPTSQIDKKSVTHVERWTETPAAPQPQLVFEEEAEFEDDSLDAFDAVMADFGGDTSEWCIKVWRLPKYSTNGHTAIRATETQFCTNLPITLDYISMVKEEFGPGTYRLELRERGRVRKMKTITIAAPAFPVVRPLSTPNNSTTLNSVPIGAIPGEPVDPIAQLRSSLGLMREIRQAFGETNHQGQVQAQVPAQQNPPLNAENVLGFLIGQDDELMDTVTKKIRRLVKGPEGEHETTMNDLLLAGINILPQMFDKAHGFISQILAAKGIVLNGQTQMGQEASQVDQSVQNQSWGSGNQTQNVSVQTQPQSAQSLAPGSSGASGLQGIPSQDEILKFATEELLKALESNHHIVAVVNWMIESEQKYGKVVGDLIDEFAETSIDNLITFLNTLPDGQRYTALPHCRTWLENLQKALKNASDPMEGDQEL